MTKQFRGVVNLDIRDSQPDWEPYLQPTAPEGAPNVLLIVWDDVGFAAMEPWGGLIETPTMNRLAKVGLTYTNMHTTALCSPTRACLMTGRNHTSNGMACISEAAIGFPNANGHIPFGNATIAEVLNENGFNTYMLGKWHLCAEDEMKMMTQPGKFSIAGEGLNVGRDGGEPVTGDYPGEYPWPFTGTVKCVVVDVSGDLNINQEVEAQMMLMRE